MRPRQISLAATSVTSAAFPLLAPNGTSAAPSYSAASFTGSGMSFTTGYVGISVGGIAYGGLTATALYVGGTTAIGWGPGGDTVTAASDTRITRVSTGILALKESSAAAAAFRVHGSATVYASIEHDGNNTIIRQVTGTGQISFASAAIATGATAGWLTIPSCAGAPTGVPANLLTGQVGIVYDSSNNRLYIYSGGWKKAQVAAVDAIYA